MLALNGQTTRRAAPRAGRSDAANSRREDVARQRSRKHPLLGQRFRRVLRGLVRQHGRRRHRPGGGRPSTASGKWHISDDGRYCILIEWKGVPTEEWCRYVLETTDGYYVTRSTSVGTERVEKFEIKK